MMMKSPLAEAMAAADAAIRAADSALLAAAEEVVDGDASPPHSLSTPIKTAVAEATQPPSPINTTIESSTTSGSPWSDGKSSSYEDDDQDDESSSSGQPHRLQLAQVIAEDDRSSSKAVGMEISSPSLSPIKRYQSSPNNSLLTETSFDTAYSSLGQMDTTPNKASAADAAPALTEKELAPIIQPELTIESSEGSTSPSTANDIHPAAEHLPDQIKEKKKSVFAQWEQKAVQNNNNVAALRPLQPLPAVIAPVKRWTPPNKKIEIVPPAATVAAATTVKRQWPPPKMNNDTATSMPATELSVDELEKLLAAKKAAAAATATIKRWTPPSKKVEGSNATAQLSAVVEQTVAVATTTTAVATTTTTADVAPVVKRWIPPTKKMEDQKHVVVADVVAPAVKKWTPPTRNIETTGVMSEHTTAAIAVADVVAPVVKRWTPPTRNIESARVMTEESTATAAINTTSVVAPVLKRWCPPSETRVVGVSEVVLTTGEQTSTTAASAVSPDIVAPVIKRWTPPAKTSNMAQMTDELASVLRRRQNQDELTDPVATEVKKPNQIAATVYTGIIWSPVEMTKQSSTSTQPASPESDGGSSASDQCSRQLTYQVESPTLLTPLPPPLSTPEAVAKSSSWNPFKKLFSSKSKDDSPTSIMEIGNDLKPNIESSIVGNAGEVGHVNLVRAFDDIENENANDIVLEGGEQVTIVASSAVVDPVIKRWVPPETKVGVAQMSVELAERLRRMIPEEDDTANKYTGNIWSTVDKTTEARSDGPLSHTMSSPPELVPPLDDDGNNKEVNEDGAAVEEDEKEEEVQATNKDDPSKITDNTAFGQVDPPAYEDETPIHLLPRDVFGRVKMNEEPSRERSNGRVTSSNVSANASMGAVTKNDSPLKSYVEKQMVWERKRKERQINDAKSGIYRSGSTNYYGLHPHCYDKVLSEMETIKKSEEELKQKEEMARKQQEFHAIVTTLVEEGKSNS